MHIPPMNDLSLRDWIVHAQRNCDMTVKPIRWDQSKEWKLTRPDLRHRTGGFFRVIGIRCDHSAVVIQPIIDQPEIGILGFLVRRNSHETEFLLQAKAEPGNVNLVQIAPSVQATQSNYQCKHGGKETPYLSFFSRAAKGTVLADSLQSEQGTRFLGKYNRNMVVEVQENLEPDENLGLRWFSVSELRELLVMDFSVNTDARSVLASAPWMILADNAKPFGRWHGNGGFEEELLRSYLATVTSCGMTGGDLLSRLESQRLLYPDTTVPVDLAEIEGWEITEEAICSQNGADFEVRHFEVMTTQREVSRWDQPLAVGLRSGEVELFCQRRRGVLHFLFDARFEPGFKEGVQYGPAWQDDGLAFLAGCDYGSLLREQAAIVISCRQSDEGGRFYRSIAQYVVRQLPDGCEFDPGQRLSWMTLGQIEELVKTPGTFSNEARSLISMLLTYV